MRQIALSVNLNKIALIRNSREGDNPNLVDYARRCIEYGANGITVHPRPDQRHIRPEDCFAIAKLVKHLQSNIPTLEFNIEGNAAAMPRPAGRPDFAPYPGYLEIVTECLPEQATLVPDSDEQLTSDHGFDLQGDNSKLEAAIAQIKQHGIRVSLFMDPDIDQISRARDAGADRVELYTGPFALAVESNDIELAKKLLEKHQLAASHARECGLGLNAGHDLNLENLTQYKTVPGLQEVSIGHALTIDSLNMGLEKTVKAYLETLVI